MQHNARKESPKLSTITQFIRGKVSNRSTKKGLVVKVIFYAKHTNAEALFEAYSDTNGNYEIELPQEGLAKFFKLVFVCENFDERSVVVDKDKVPKQLNVTLMPQVVITITTSLPEVEVAVKHTALSERYSYSHLGGIPTQIETTGHTSKLRWNFFYRIKWKLKKLFKRKRLPKTVAR